jgi:hypothetical protein
MTAHRELESRYRRLMAAYPGWHRREYEEEMVGVLLTDAAPGQRRPGLRSQADLVVSALVVRLRGVVRGSRDDAWRRAAQAAQIAGMMILLAVGVRRLVLATSAATLYPVDVVRPVGWALALAATLLGLRRTACGLAVLGAAAEIWRVALWYADSPSRVLMAGWLITTATVAAVVSVWMATGPAVTRPRGLWWFGGALTAGVAARFADDIQASGFFSGGWAWGVTLNGTFLLRYAAPLYLVAAGLAAGAWWRQEPPVRRRLVTFAAPVAATAALVTYGFAGFMYSSQRFSSPVLLAPVQWVVLGVTPPVAFALALAVVDRWERLNQLIALGRLAEADPSRLAKTGPPENIPPR